MAKSIENLFQRVGEGIQQFAYRVDQAYGNLEDSELIRKILQGLNPSIVSVMPNRDRQYTIDELMWFGENLKDFLPADDPHWSHNVVGPINKWPNIGITINSDKPNEPRKVGPPLPAQPRKATDSSLCYRCQNTDHYAYECKLPKVKAEGLPPRRRKRKNSVPYPVDRTKRSASMERRVNRPYFQRRRANRCSNPATPNESA